MLDRLVSLLSGKIDAAFLRDLVDRIWRIERRFTYPAFEEAAAFEAETVRGWGLEARVYDAPADGKTCYGLWRMPLAWDCTRGAVTIATPPELAGRVLADADRCPTHVAMWSGPTPTGGLTAPVVHVEAGELDSADVRGKIVLTPTEAGQVKSTAAAHGAAALVSYWTKHPEENARAVSWINAWSDDPDGWAFHEGDAPLPGISISPAQGAELAELVRRHPGLTLRIEVESRYYEGSLPSACFLLPGSPGAQEVMAIGHGQEQGANDNASGIAAIMCAMRAIHELVRDGTLPRPRRSIRGLTVSECYGTYAWAERQPEIVSRTLCALNLDSVGETFPRCRSTLRLYHNPDAAIHYSDSLLGHLLRRHVRPRVPDTPVEEAAFSLFDNGMADPAYGVPSVVLSCSGDVFWHTSGDDIEKVDPEMLKWVTVATGAFLYTVASADERTAGRLAELTRDRAVDELGRIADGADASDSLRGARLPHRAERARAELRTTSELVDDGARAAHEEVLARCGRAIDEARDAACKALGIQARSPVGLDGGRAPAGSELVVPVRRFRGSQANDTLARDDRGKVRGGRWDAALTAACFWADGKRTLAEVARLAWLERGADPAKTVRSFERMAELGLVELRPAGT